MRYIATLIALVAITGVASAAVEPTLTYTIGGVAGNNTTDISINAGIDWTSAVLVVTPDATGQIFQDTFFGAPNDNPPASGQIAFQASLAYDTFISDGQLVDRTKTGAISTVANGQATPVLQSTDLIDLGWFTTNTDDLGAMTLARVTIAAGATGTWSFQAFDASSASEAAWVGSGTIEDGMLVIPEPATMLVMIGGGLGFLARRRRK
jgi:hypothetical protein